MWAALADQVTTTRSAAGVAVSAVIVIYLAVVVVSIVAAVKIVTKAGYSGWWVLVTLVPILNFVMLLVFAFSEWPVVREVKALRAQATSWSPYGPPGYGGPAGFGGSYPSGPTMPNDRGPDWGSGPPSGGAPPAEPVEAEPPLPPFESIVPSATSGPGRPSTTAEGDSATAPQDDRDLEQGAQAGPGWYPTPDGRVRYWDGTAWTDHFA